MTTLSRRSRFHISDTTNVVWSYLKKISYLLFGYSSMSQSANSNDILVGEFVRASEFRRHILHVHSVFSREQVRWVAAYRVVATMAYIKISRFVCKLPSNPVRSNNFTHYFNPTVAVRSEARPRPAPAIARASIDARPEPIWKPRARIHGGMSVTLEVFRRFSGNLPLRSISTDIGFCKKTASAFA